MLLRAATVPPLVGARPQHCRSPRSCPCLESRWPSQESPRWYDTKPPSCPTTQYQRWSPPAHIESPETRYTPDWRSPTSVFTATGSWWPVATLPLALVGVGRVVIGPEQRYLANQFGQLYSNYRAQVRRWL